MRQRFFYEQMTAGASAHYGCFDMLVGRITNKSYFEIFQTFFTQLRQSFNTATDFAFINIINKNILIAQSQQIFIMPLANRAKTDNYDFNFARLLSHIFLFVRYKYEGNILCHKIFLLSTILLRNRQTLF